jgi:metallo-beta-lactamase family protein
LSNAATIQFLGGAGTVTGSKHLLTACGRHVLLDCGLFQGLKALRLRNWAKPSFRARDIDAVVLSHAHVDHSGYLPLLQRNGFRGPILCTPGTRDLLEIMLMDAAHLQEEEAEFANRHGYSKHHPALPLFTISDAEAALRQVETRRHGETFAVVDGISARLRRAGHILGSAIVELQIEGAPDVHVVYSGDLGRSGRPILNDPERIAAADFLLVESTYGDRLHSADPAATLAEVVAETSAAGGTLLIPAFAVGRTQELMWLLRELERERRIPVLPVFVDSPMAAHVTDVYQRHIDDRDPDMRLSPGGEGDPLQSSRCTVIRTAKESKALNGVRGPMVIISASGMATGGRILHHLKARLPDPRTTVLLPGFQACGTRGRSLQDGAKVIRMLGENVPVRARVVVLDGLSAHADREETLGWLSGFASAPRQTHVVHGEPVAADSLASAIRDRLGWNASVAADGETAPLRA